MSLNVSEISKGQIMSWYHAKILRIPHGDQNPKKRYLKDSEILELFTGFVHIQEKVDGKLSCGDFYIDKNGLTRINLYEDMTGKNTCHKHIEYLSLPFTKKVYFDDVVIKDGKLLFTSVPSNLANLDLLSGLGGMISTEEIYELLESLSKSESYFGRKRIEGLVIKNYEKQLMGKWINDEFEDHLKNGGC